MCGIAGIYDDTINWNQRESIVRSMLTEQVHRGPDHADVWSEGAVSFVHNRLKILDLSDGANQPFEYDHIILVFNGEIYNYIELRQELTRFGYRFRTQTDTEVLAAAYLHWNKKCVDHLVGMWAFAVWDRKEHVMFCSRDRFGIKPFYYTIKSNTFYFASELHTLVNIPGKEYTYNTSHLNRGLLLGWSEYQDETSYNEIRSLEAAHNIVISKERITIEKYWELQQDYSLYENMSEAERTEMFRSGLSLSVNQHSRSDVKVGGCLSGGLDSSSITGLYCTLFPEKDYHTFTIYYEGQGKVDERPFAQSVANRFPGVIPHFYSPSDQEVKDHYSRATYFADGPLLSSTFLSQYFVMREAAQEGVKVLLDGQGSDEYLFGYMHTFSRLIGGSLRSGNGLSAVQKLIAHRSQHDLSAKQTLDVLLKSTFMALFSEQKVYEHEYTKYHSLLNGSARNTSGVQVSLTDKDLCKNFLHHLLFTTSLPTLLHFEDRMSMSYSIESRVPFLDHRLVELACSLPAKDRIAADGTTKSILRNSMKGILPELIIQRRDKKAFNTPGETHWMRGPLKDLLLDDFNNLDWLDARVIRALITDYQSGSDKNAKLIWRLAGLNHWINLNKKTTITQYENYLF